jgi:sugar-specific transcriptional regulator TrmB
MEPTIHVPPEHDVATTIERELQRLAAELDRAASALAELARAARATCEARGSRIEVREALVAIVRGRS